MIIVINSGKVSIHRFSNGYNAVSFGQRMTTLIRQCQRINETRLLCIQTSHVQTSLGAIYLKRLYRSGRNKIKGYAPAAL